MTTDEIDAPETGSKLGPEHGKPTLERARALYRQGYSPIPIPYRSKGPVIKGWQNLEIPESELSKYFNGVPSNIGVRLGAPSGWRIDVDLDCPEAISLADQLLPATTTFGRTSKPRSHYLYIARGAETQKFVAPDGTMLVEIRSTGAQTVFPGSTHEGGEEITWTTEPATPVAAIGARELAELVGKLAAGALLARAWKKDVRHEAALCLAGGLCRLGRSADDIIAFVTTVAEAANDDQVSDRIRAVKDTVAKFERGENVKGFTSLREILGDDSVSRVLKWLGATETDPRPVVRWDPINLHTTVTNTVNHLRSVEGLYQRNGNLVRVLTHPGSPSPRIEEVNNLPEVLAKHIRFEKWEPKPQPKAAGASDLLDDFDGPREWVSATVFPIVQHIANRRDYPGVPPLRGLIECPSLRPDGSILATPGYDVATGLFYAPSADLQDLRLPETCTQEDARTARTTLLEVFQDFPYLSEVHRDAALAALLTPFARPAIGAAPLFCFDANTPGTGKGLHVDAISNIVVGHDAAKEPFVSSEDEIRKKITSLALAGRTFVVFDNVKNKLGNSTLDAALTATIWADRLLGKTEDLQIPLNVTWYATGNNIELGGDTPRRVLPIRLESSLENPETRTGFAQPDLLKYIRANRARLVSATLTILRAYFAAGCPNPPAPWGAFEDWSRIVRGAVIFAGGNDPYNTREVLTASDPQKGVMAVFLKALSEHPEGLTATEILKLKGGLNEMVEALAELVAAKEGCPTSRQIGCHLSKWRGRVVEGMRLVRAGEHRPKWMVQAVEAKSK